MAFLENELATVDAIAAREMVNPEQFKSGISKTMDGTVTLPQCLALGEGRGYITRFQRSFELDQSQNPHPKIANYVILGWASSRVCRASADFFAPGFEVFLHLRHELVGHCAVEQAVVVAQR